MQRAASILIFITLAIASGWSMRLAIADSAFGEGSPEGTERAVQILPHNSAYLAVQALQQEYAGDDARPTLLRLAELNPTSSAPRIRLGLDAEQQGDFAEAEKWLLEAYSVDHQFEPRWTLANFYFRRDRTAEFWRWTRSALEVSYGDRAPVFDLCWRVTEDAAVIQQAIPKSAADAYLLYLMGREKIDAVARAAERASDPTLLTAATDLLLGAGHGVDAISVWKRVRGVVPQGIASPHFEQPQTGRGFDWKFAEAEGVTHQQLEAGRGHRIRLSGSQPESVLLMRVFAANLAAGKLYGLDAQIDNALPGLEWRAGNTRLNSNEFRASDEVIDLQLWYVRPRGEVRAEGAFDIAEVRVSALQ